MDMEEIKYLTRRRAASLLGIEEQELMQISHECGLGHCERVGAQEETYFTYDELRQICTLAAHEVH